MNQHDNLINKCNRNRKRMAKHGIFNNNNNNKNKVRSRAKYNNTQNKQIQNSSKGDALYKFTQ